MTNIKMSTITFGGEEIFNITDEKSVHFNKAQTLTEEEKKQARTNIGAVSADIVGKLSEEIEDVNGDLSDLENNTLYIFSYPNLIINQNDYTNNFFLNPNTGNEIENTSWLYLNQYIQVKESTTYHGCFFDKETRLKRSTFSCFVCFYDVNKKCIGEGLSSITDEMFTTPKNAAYCRLSFGKQNFLLFDLQLEEGEVYTPYHPYGKFEILKGESVDLYVGSDFLDIKKALDFVFLTRWNDITNINIHIPNGTYNIFSYYDASTTVRGIELDENITLVGESRDGTILYGELDPSAYPYDVRTCASTVNLNGGGNLKHLTVKGKNIRYAVHPDTVSSDYTDKITNYHRLFEDCVFEYLGFETGNDGHTWPGGAVGSGVRSECEMIFKNCNFIGNESNPFGCHSNINFYKPAYVKLENCTFTVTGESNLWIPIRSLDSTVKNVIEFIGCKFGCPIAMNPSGSETFDWDIRGYGNTETLQINSFTDGQNPYCNFNEEVIFLRNNSGNVISKGTPVKKDTTSFGGTTAVVPMANDDIVAMFFGVCLCDTVNGDLCPIRVKGYFRTNLTYGKRVTVKNGALSVMQPSETGDYVGITDTSLGYTRFL